MTTVETERVSAPSRERRDAREERERRASTLEAAALEIEVRGWTQFTFCGRNGEVCLTGAIHHASNHESVSSDFLNSGDGVPHPMGWNDTPGRTADEVTFLLRWRAEEIRDGR